MAYLDAHRREVVEGRELGVEPICEVLQVAPSTYYAAKSRPPSRRSVTDTERLDVIRTVHQENYGVYGVSKVHAEMIPAAVTRSPGARSTA